MVNVGMIKYLFPRRPFNNDSPKLLVGINPAKKSAIAVEIATIAKGWQAMVVPALLVGTLGYVIGNYYGIFIGTFLGR